MAKPNIVILGGGFGGLFTALELSSSGNVTLVSDEDHFLFTPMLYEYLSGEVEEWHIAPRYSELLDDNIHFVQDQVDNIDLNSQSVSFINSGERLQYDVLVLAV